MTDKKVSDNKLKSVFKEIQLKIEYSRDILKTFKHNRNFIKEKIKELPIKFRIQANMRYEKPGDSNDVIERWVSTKQTELLTIADFDNSFNKLEKRLVEVIEEATLKGSGWSTGEVLELKLQIAKYNPIRGSSYFPLCKELQDKKAIINVKNMKDNKCFMWCVLARLYILKDHPERISQYKHFTDRLNFKNISFPIQLEDITKFEEQNQDIWCDFNKETGDLIPGSGDSITVNVYKWNPEDKLVPLRISENSPTFDNLTRFHVDLLLITDPDNPDHKHYTLIKNMSRLIFDLTKYEGKKYFCRKCLTRVNDLQQADKHIKTCKSPTDVETELVLPEEGSKLKFTNICKQFKHPYVVYADFECLLIKEPTVTINKTFSIQRHEVCSYGYIVVEPDGIAKDPVIYRRENAARNFLLEMKKIQEKIAKKLKDIVKMVFTDMDKEDFKKATDCHICKKPFKDDEKKVRDHDHLTGWYRGAAHNKCNLDYCIKNYKLPIFFHNLKGYDSHIIMQAVNEEYKKIFLIPETDEKYKTFTLDNTLSFYDSLQHLPNSLSSLAKGLSEYPITSKYFNDTSLIKKGVYPYEYMDDWSRFEEESLPPKECFYSTLTKTGITDDDYKHAQNVWNKLECETLGDYHDKYLLADVCLLADVFEK